MKGIRKIIGGILFTSVLLAPLAQSKASPAQVVRIAGDSRYETSIKLSAEGFDRASSAVIACGESFPDALVGGTLAGYTQAPLLITPRDDLSQELIAELKRLGTTSVFLLGGETSLSKEIENKLQKDYEVIRLAGSNRYQTAEAVSEYISNHYKTDQVFYASGTQFPDALAGAPLVVASKGVLKLSAGGISSGTALGGERSLPGMPDLRLSGENRYATSVTLATEIASLQETLDTVILVSGATFPDALSASGYAAYKKAAILLTEGKTLSKEAETFIKDFGIQRVVILGGTSSVSKNVERVLQGLSPLPEPEKPQETQTERAFFQTENLSNKRKDWSWDRPDDSVKKFNAHYNMGGKRLFLTMDFGEDYGYTDRILDTLKGRGVKATFFVTTEYIQNYPDYVKRMSDEGHVIGNHSTGHINMVKLLGQSASKLEANTKAWEKAMDDLLGYHTKLYRAPEGVYSVKGLASLSNMGYDCIFWGAAYKDYDPKNQPSVKTAFKQINARTDAGDIVLLHPMNTNAQILDDYIDHWRAQGMTFEVLASK